MIKINEIRVGNLFTYCNNEDEYPFELSDFVSLNEYELSLEDIKPIRITDKKLCDIGFEKDNTYFTKWINEHECIILAKGNNNYYLCDTDFNVKMEFIHELQNFYYDLKKEDLIK